MITEVKKLSVAFCSVDNAFIASLVNRIVENKFTKQRIKDAINQVIDTCKFPPKIADVVSFDRKVKTYSYNEMIAMCNQYRTSEDFEMVLVDGKKRWIEK